MMSSYKSRRKYLIMSDCYDGDRTVPMPIIRMTAAKRVEVFSTLAARSLGLRTCSYPQRRGNNNTRPKEHTSSNITDPSPNTTTSTQQQVTSVDSKQFLITSAPKWAPNIIYLPRLKNMRPIDRQQLWKQFNGQLNHHPRFGPMKQLNPFFMT